MILRLLQDFLLEAMLGEALDYAAYCHTGLLRVPGKHLGDIEGFLRF
jgi:hypothetical protein